MGHSHYPELEGGLEAVEGGGFQTAFDTNSPLKVWALCGCPYPQRLSLFARSAPSAILSYDSTQKNKFPSLIIDHLLALLTRPS